MSVIGRLRSGGPTIHESFVAGRLRDGTFFDHVGGAWLFSVLPCRSLQWEDAAVRRDAANNLHTMLVELGRLSKGAPRGLGDLAADYREFHLTQLSWFTPVPIPEGTPPSLAEWLDPIFGQFRVGNTLFAIGVRLRRKRPVNLRSFSDIAKTILGEARGELPDPRLFAADRSAILPILQRAGGRAPTNAEAARLESWWNGGRGSDAVIVADPDGHLLSCDAWPEGLEFSSVIGFEEDRYDFADGDGGLWVMEAFGHYEGCVAFGVKGELHPAKVARQNMRRIQKKALGRIEEESHTQDLDREEDERLLSSAAALESMFLQTGEPLVRNASVVGARRASQVAEDYTDHLRTKWGLDLKVLEYRQHEALQELWPCGPRNFGLTPPFAQDMTLGILAGSGIGAFSSVGDKSGIWIGVAPPNMSPVWLDPMGSSKSDKPPALAICGEPGAGKTFLLQAIATQASRVGLPAVFVNPKPADRLDGFALACGGEVITISALEKRPGVLDPFRYASPDTAAEIAIAHITCALTEMPEAGEVRLAAGIRRAATEGARCVGEALRHESVPQDMAQIVFDQCQASSLFQLGVSDKPLGPLGLGSGKGLTLVQFDRPITLPPTAAPINTYDRNTRVAVAAVRLICRAALEQMLNQGGGVLILDEAHVFMASEEGRAIIQRLGREGRSQRILPILATQRIADVIADGADMGSYLGRVIVMKMTDEREAGAALRLCGFEPTPERRRFLADAGPVRDGPEKRGALSLFRDLNGHCSAVMHGPWTSDIHGLFSTNPLDREMLDKVALEAAV